MYLLWITKEKDYLGNIETAAFELKSTQKRRNKFLFMFLCSQGKFNFVQIKMGK